MLYSFVYLYHSFLLAPRLPADLVRSVHSTEGKLILITRYVNSPRWSHSSVILNSRLTSIAVVSVFRYAKDICSECWVYTQQVGVWSFVVGYLVQSVASLVSQGPSVFTKKGKYL